MVFAEWTVPGGVVRKSEGFTVGARTAWRGAQAGRCIVDGLCSASADRRAGTLTGQCNVAVGRAVQTVGRYRRGCRAVPNISQPV